MIRKNIISILLALVILYLSLASAPSFDTKGIFNIPYADKYAHFGLYFLFMAAIIAEHRTLFRNTRQIILTAFIPFIFGIMIEFLQSGLTLTRKGDILDVIFNSCGIASAVFIWLLIKPYQLRETKS